MLGGFLAWISLLFEPISNHTFPPIPPQERLIPREQQRPWQHIITGLRGPPVLTLHDRDGVRSWSFERNKITQNLPPDVRDCFNSDYEDVPEVKYMNNGNSVGAIFGDSALVINHTPDNPATDKLITFALCLHDNDFENTHTLEPLPGNRLAVATTGQRSWDGIVIFNASAANPLTGNPPILQNITGFPTVHAMVWDEQGQILWAAGTDAAADASDPVPAYSTLIGYPWDAAMGLLRESDRRVYKLSKAYDLEAEWGKDDRWWAGMHELVPIPNQRKFLMSEDRGLHAFDIETGQFTEHYEDVTNKYLQGFEPVDDTRHGYNAEGEWEALPQSDVKSISMAPEGSFLYVQALWGQYRGNATNLVVNGHRHEIDLGSEIYRSRWFEDIDGWPKP